jgi:hypothetical protein
MGGAGVEESVECRGGLSALGGRGLRAEFLDRVVPRPAKLSRTSTGVVMDDPGRGRGRSRFATLCAGGRCLPVAAFLNLPNPVVKPFQSRGALADSRTRFIRGPGTRRSAARSTAGEGTNENCCESRG